MEISLNKAAELARLMTGSTLSDNAIIKQVKSTSDQIRQISSMEIDSLARKHNMPFDKGFPQMKMDFSLIAAKYSLDPATLFWIYMDWLKERQ